MIAPQTTLELALLESVRVPLFLTVPKARHHGRFVAPLRGEVSRDGGPDVELTTEARFVGPLR